MSDLERANDALQRLGMDFHEGRLERADYRRRQLLEQARSGAAAAHRNAIVALPSAGKTARGVATLLLRLTGQRLVLVLVLSSVALVLASLAGPIFMVTG